MMTPPIALPRAMRVMIRRASERGELRPGTDEEIALELALGPLYVRTPITRRPIDDAFIKRFVDTLLRGLLPRHIWVWNTGHSAYGWGGPGAARPLWSREWREADIRGRGEDAGPDPKRR